MPYYNQEPTMSVIQLGSRGEEVKLLQKALSELTGTRLSFDGSFGALSVSTLKAFQIKYSVSPTGVYDEATRALIGPFVDRKYIRVDEIDQYAHSIGVDPNILKAIAIKEAKASGFTPSGRCLILYERHIFYRYASSKFGASRVDGWTKENANLCYPSGDQRAYMGGEREWDRLNTAKNWDAETALISCSWGMFQIMGFNFGLAGYESIGDFVMDMSESERYHIQALASFIKNNRPLYTAVKSKNFQQIALYYNGRNYKMNNYDRDLMNIYQTLLRKG